MSKNERARKLKALEIAYLVRVGSDGNAEGTGQTKISELDDTLRIDEQVLRFEIAVKHTVLVTVLETAQQLPHVALFSWINKAV